MQNRLSLIMLLCWMGSFSLFAQKKYSLQSPDQQLQTEVFVDETITFSLSRQGKTLLAPSEVALTLGNGTVLGSHPKVLKVFKSIADKEIVSPFYKKSTVKDVYNEMRINFKGDFSLTFRLYDDGMAYRFSTHKKGKLVIQEEKAHYCFPADHKTFAPYVNSDKETFEEQFSNSFEQPYVNERITQLNARRLTILPLLVDLDNGMKMCITEADLEDYPGMFLNNDTQKPVLKAVHAPYPKVKKQGGHNQLQLLVKERENYIAKTEGTRSFPWRVFVISDKDQELADCDMVYRLASPSRLKDISWIKPGKVAWEWWNNWNLFGVDFKAGINNDTYKYYIDFAAKHGIEYVILDEGWSVNLEADLMKVVPEIDLQALVDYGKSKKVGIILWAGYYAFDRDMQQVVEHYARMGVKGFKIDFMDRDDQEIIQFLYRAAQCCADYKMLVDFHGICKPTGLQRTYPNVLNYEGVHGLEQVKWSPESNDMVTYDVTIPFIRMVAGPMDYTQGAMHNAGKGNFAAIYSEPMSQGTRCRQLATYVVFESPFNMLCDSPSNYEREEECTQFIARIPTVWDETVALDGKVGEHIAMARRKGDVWYVGALTGWSPRDITLDLSFLGEGEYVMELYKDGINADRAGRDYKKETLVVPAHRKVEVHLAPGGGCAARITKK